MIPGIGLNNPCDSINAIDPIQATLLFSVSLVLSVKLLF